MRLWIREDLRPLFEGLTFDDFLRLGEQRVRLGPDGARHTSWFRRSGRRFFLKVHTGVGWAEIVKCGLQGKRPIVDASPEARALERLARVGLPTPRLAAYGIRGRNPARRRSFVLTEALEATEDLGEYLEQAQPLSPPLRRALAREVGRITGGLHAARLLHQDLYLTHFRIRRGEGDAFELFLLDFHRALPQRADAGRWSLKDLAALHYSTLGLPVSRTDRLRFWRAYLAYATGAERRPLDRDLLHRIEARARVIELRIARRGPNGNR